MQDHDYGQSEVKVARQSMMMLLIQTTLLLSSCITYGMEQTMNDCNCEGAIGGKPSALDPSPSKSVSGLFLNTHPDSRAPCDGRVMAWDFCYYIFNDTQQQDNDSTKIEAGVWRQQGSSEYRLVNNSWVELPIPEPASGLQFVCQHWSLSDTDNATFEIKKGDIVGIYVEGMRVVHVLGNSTNDAQDNEIMSAVDVDIETPVSELNSTSYSLYLKALLENPTCPCTCSNHSITQSTLPTISTPGGTSDPNPAATEKSWEYYAIGGLAVMVFLLLITIIATICRLLYLHKRSKGSEPVLVKKMRSGKQKITRILMISQEPAVGQHVSGTESEAEDGDSSSGRSQHTIAQLHKPPTSISSLSNTNGMQIPQEQGEPTSTPTSPPAVVFAASFDIEQLSDDDDQGRSTFKPSRQKPAHTKAQKITSVPNSDLRRSHSAADVIGVPYSNNCPYTASTEYPYVLHAFEVVGRSPTHIGSLPNIMKHHFLEDQATNPPSDGKWGTANFQMDTATDDSNSDTDDDPSYSYADRRHMTAENLLSRKSTLPSIVESAANQDYHYDEYPSAWNPTSQLLVQTTTQNSNEYAMNAHNQTESPALPPNQVSPVNQKQSNDDDVPVNPLPPKPKVKPTIKPRKRLAHKPTPNHALLHFPTGVNAATEEGDQTSSSGRVIQKQGSSDILGDGTRLAAQTSPTYMKLLQTTKDDDHRYTYLFNGGTELSEQSVRDPDSERAHPKEWYKQTKC